MFIRLKHGQSRDLGPLPGARGSRLSPELARSSARNSSGARSQSTPEHPWTIHGASLEHPRASSEHPRSTPEHLQSTPGSTPEHPQNTLDHLWSIPRASLSISGAPRTILGAPWTIRGASPEHP